MIKLPLNGCKNIRRQEVRNCKMHRILEQLEQKCLDRQAILSTINDKKLFQENNILLFEIKQFKSLIKN